MAWCPKCHLEYQDGYTECNDCKVPLVSYEEAFQKEKVELLSMPEEEPLERLREYLDYSGIKDTEISYDEETEMYTFLVREEDRKSAAKFYQGFRQVEMEKEAERKKAELEAGFSEDSEAEEDSSEQPEPITFSRYSAQKSEVYRGTKDRYQDFSFTGYTFIVVGILCIAYAGLTFAGILTFLKISTLSLGMISAIGIACIIIGIQSLSKAKVLKGEIGDEETLSHDITEWLKANITQETLAPVVEEDDIDEIKYFKQLEYMKESVIEEFGEQNEAFLDQLCDNYYHELFS